MRCFAILLAAGLSSRFGGQNKLLAPFRGKPLARHTLDLVCGMGCFEKIFFVYADKAAASLADGLPVTVVYNPAPEKGQGESAWLGLMAAVTASDQSDQSDVYYMFFPCDQPLLDQGTVRLLLDAARPGCITEPACAGGNSSGGNRSPSLFCASFRDELLALEQGALPRLLKARHPRSVITVEIANPALLADIDTLEDLQFWESRTMQLAISN
ncbi:MAG: nucleotidyltransferase family protein [Treponema sp.]|jgi:molybdenum cofactor cytidylyltransferase|nr:nucleotidyltransferase family protein [Treponema sp.]